MWVNRAVIEPERAQQRYIEHIEILYSARWYINLLGIPIPGTEQNREWEGTVAVQNAI